jgi:hypothetical protein
MERERERERERRQTPHYQKQNKRRQQEDADKLLSTTAAPLSDIRMQYSREGVLLLAVLSSDEDGDDGCVPIDTIAKKKK